MLNPLRVAEKAFGIGAGLVGGAVNAARGAVGQSNGERSERAPEHRPPPERRPAKPSITDAALADKVQSVLFSDASVPKAKIDVNAVGRDVYLRGEAKTPDMINELERRTLAIPEVARVENLLHLPKTPAPTRADAPDRAQKTRRTKGASPARKRTAKKVNAEAKTTVGETPKELAAKGQGRKPAPMGSTGKAAPARKGASAKKASTAKKSNGSSASTPAKPANAAPSPKPKEDAGG